MKTHNLRNILLFPDVNPGGGSSDASTESAGGSSVDMAATPEADDSSNADVKPGPSVAQATDKIIADVLAKHAPKKDSSTEEKEDAEQSGSTEDQDQEKEKAEEKVDSEADAQTEEDGEKKEEVVENGPVPYERFKEVNDKVAEYESKVKEYEPLAQAHQSIIDFCQTNNISNEDFTQMLEIGRLIQVDPMAAKKAIEPIWNTLNGLTGETLPPDLQKEVDDGVLTEKYAKEIARLRGNRQFSDLQSQNTQRRLQQDQQRQFVNAVQTSVKTWSDTKVISDPDFKPKPGPNAPDGKYEVFLDKFTALTNRSQIRSVADAVKIAEQAYADVNRLFTSLRPKPTASKSVSSTKSTNKTTSTGEKTPFVQGGAVPTGIIESVLSKYRK